MMMMMMMMFRLKESLSGLDGSKSVGAGGSLQRGSSLSLLTLPHRSKSFQSKLNFGDTSDDVHVSVQCLRAVMNNQVQRNSSSVLTDVFFCIFVSWVLCIFCEV